MSSTQEHDDAKARNNLRLAEHFRKAAERQAEHDEFFGGGDRCPEAEWHLEEAGYGRQGNDG